MARREGLTDVHICQAVVEMNTGLIDVNLGAGLFKKRIAMPGQGKRGSWRALLGFQAGKKAFFLYLFPKNSRDDIEDDEMKALKRLTRYYCQHVPILPFIPVGNGLNRWTLVYDKDVGRAAALAVSHPAVAGRVFNVTDGGFHTLRPLS